ncbi:30S ribosomal protein S19e [Nanoarchaeota archaeon NZ13-N]|nr:MAG: 30S ribosomal protein S19e [Nanoarchaeota archaeon NZ13-N]
MPTAFEVPGQILVDRLARYLFENYKDIIKPPYWAKFVKTGPHNERPPDFPADQDYQGGPGWWYYRAASVLRQVYLRGPIGISRLRKKYGGLRKRGMEVGKFKRGYGKIVRTILQQLEMAGLVTKSLEGKRKGRVVTSQGRSLIDKLSSEIYRELMESNKNIVEQIKNYL